MKVLSVQKNSKNCIICGMENEFGLQAPFYVLDDDSVASVFEFKMQHQSYPNRTHGGMITALLDELMGRALWINEPNLYGVTTSLNVTFRRPVPYGEKLKARGFITFNSNRGFTAKGEIYSMDNKLLAQANCKYLKLSAEQAFGQNANEHNEMIYTPPIEIDELDFPPKSLD